MPISEILWLQCTRMLHGVRIKDREAKTSCGVEARGVQVVICRCEPEPEAAAVSLTAATSAVPISLAPQESVQTSMQAFLPGVK